MVRILKYLALCMLLGLPSSGVRGDITYNVTADYSPTINPNGVWTYGWQLESALGAAAINVFDTNSNFSGAHADFNFWSSSALSVVPFAGKQQSNVDSGDQSGTLYKANQVAMHAGNSGADVAAAVIRFTAPTAGNYRIDEAIFEYRSNIPGNSVYVFNNGTKIFEDTTGVRGTQNLMASQILQLSSGGYIDFIVGSRNGATNSTTTQLNAVITQVTAVPEPSSVALVLVSAVGVGFVRFRRRG